MSSFRVPAPVMGARSKWGMLSAATSGNKAEFREFLLKGPVDIARNGFDNLKQSGDFAVAEGRVLLLERAIVRTGLRGEENPMATANRGKAASKNKTKA